MPASASSCASSFRYGAAYRPCWRSASSPSFSLPLVTFTIVQPLLSAWAQGMSEAMTTVDTTHSMTGTTPMAAKTSGSSSLFASDGPHASSGDSASVMPPGVRPNSDGTAHASLTFSTARSVWPSLSSRPALQWLCFCPSHALQYPSPSLLRPSPHLPYL